MAQVIIDTNIFITIFAGDAALKNKVDSLDGAICTIAHLEMLQGSKNKRELQIIENYLQTFELVAFSKPVTAKAIELVRRFSNSHNLMQADAIIAATCIVEDLPLLTFNVKDFCFIPDLRLTAI